MAGKLEEHHKELMIPHWRVKRRTMAMATEFVEKQDDDGEETIFITLLTGGASFAEMFLDDVARLGWGEHAAKDNIGVSSYGKGDKSSREPKIVQPLKNPEEVKGKKLILLEDIRDTGISLDMVVKYFEELGAISIEVIALLAKPEAEEIKSSVDSMYGFLIPKEFVVGVGIDWAENYRIMRGIWRIVKHKNGVTVDQRKWYEKLLERANIWIDRLVA